MTFTITDQAVHAALPWLIGILVFGGLLKLADTLLGQRRHRDWVDRQRKLDDDRERADAERAALRRRAFPLPGPALAGECTRRLAYADACDRTHRPREADRQRAVAGNLGALAHMCMAAGDEPDREDWSSELAAARLLIGADLLPVPGWEDPRPAPAATAVARETPYAEKGTPRWVEAVTALAEATRENMQPDDFGPGTAGRGVLTSANAYGYAAAPELPRETVEAFLRDWCLSLHGEPAEQTWPVALPGRDPSRMIRVRLGDGDDFEHEVAMLRDHLDTVLRPLDFRGLYGRGKSQIVEEIRERFGTPRLTDELVDEFVTDYTYALTGQTPRHPDWWARHLPQRDESRVMPLRHDLQPAEVLEELDA